MNQTTTKELLIKHKRKKLEIKINSPKKAYSTNFTSKRVMSPAGDDNVKFEYVKNELNFS